MTQSQGVMFKEISAEELGILIDSQANNRFDQFRRIINKPELKFTN